MQHWSKIKITSRVKNDHFYFDTRSIQTKPGVTERRVQTHTEHFRLPRVKLLRESGRFYSPFTSMILTVM